MEATVADRIQRYIKEELVFDDGSRHFTDDTPLFGGVIDSMGLIELVAFLEKEFVVQIDDQDLTAENFRSVASITRLVTGLQSGT